MKVLSKKEELIEDQAIESCALRNQEDVLEAIDWIEDDICCRRWNLACFSDEYIETLMITLEKFKKRILESELPPLSGKWGYEIQVGEEGITLGQCRLGYSYNYRTEKFDLIVTPLKMYSLIEVGANLLTPEQYGEKYDLPSGTIRQWIRRCKIHSAIKKGHSWLIPELSLLTASGEIKYTWEDSPFDPDDDYAYLNEYDSANFTRAEEKGCFVLNLYKAERGRQLIYRLDKGIILESKEKEKLEIFLLSSPSVNREIYPFIHVFKKRTSDQEDDNHEEEEPVELKLDVFTAVEAYRRAINEEFRKNHPRKKYDRKNESGEVETYFEVPDLFTIDEWKLLPRGQAGSLGRAFFNLVKDKSAGSIEFSSGGRNGYRARYKLIKGSLDKK